MTELKPCKVCTVRRETFHGIMVTSLQDLKAKGGELLGLWNQSLSVLLEEDGTIVEDEGYFLYLPADTKFMLLRRGESWSPSPQTDSAPAGGSSEDSVDGLEPWRGSAVLLRQDLTNIILMSEENLQSLLDVPCSDLAVALGFKQQKTQILQDTLQRILDEKEEERQSRELLKLYLKAVEQEAILDQQEQSTDRDETDFFQVENAASFSSRTLKVLQSKTHPETRLSCEELKTVMDQGDTVLQEVLSWSSEQTSELLHACECELQKRSRQTQAMTSLSAQRQSRSEPDGNSKRRKE